MQDMVVKGEVKDQSLAEFGLKRILWADSQMPVLRQVREDFTQRQPLKGLKIGACLHVTAETANLVRTLKAGGADVSLCASNPLSTQDNVAASMLKDFDISVFALSGEDNETYDRHINLVLDTNPQITMDNGTDLLMDLHRNRPEQMKAHIKACIEETTTGVVRLRSMERSQRLKTPVFAVNDSETKNLFDNRYGTGQSTLDGILRATNILLAGQYVVVCGYGWCGKGIALRARGLGAKVIVVEVNAIRALEATLEGFEVMPLNQAAPLGNIFITATGDLNVIRREHFKVMKDGTVICNAGHFNAEIDIPALEELSGNQKQEVKPMIQAYQIGSKKLYLLAEGRLINMTAAEGHPASVMDISFAAQSRLIEYINIHHQTLSPQVYSIPTNIDQNVALLKLKAMGINIDDLTPEQQQYIYAWDIPSR